MPLNKNKSMQNPLLQLFGGFWSFSSNNSNSSSPLFACHLLCNWCTSNFPDGDSQWKPCSCSTRTYIYKTIQATWMASKSATETKDQHQFGLKALPDDELRRANSTRTHEFENVSNFCSSSGRFCVTNFSRKSSCWGVHVTSSMLQKVITNSQVRSASSPSGSNLHELFTNFYVFALCCCTLWCSAVTEQVR
jgi:hypothetical protein